jgi:hypothetical protein
MYLVRRAPFEPFEEKVTDLDIRVEHEVERELDLQRGK